MRRRGIVILGIVFVMSMQLMGTNAQTILRKAREDYYKQQAAAEKAEKEKEKIEKERVAAEARTQRESTRTQRAKVEVNEEKLKHLSKKRKEELFNKNAIPLITAHLISLSNIKRFS